MLTLKKKTSNQQFNFTMQGTRTKEEQIQPKGSRWKEIMKLRMETNKIENRKTVEKNQ